VDDVRVHKQNSALYSGTVVTAQIIRNDQKLIQQALVFKGKAYERGFDYIGQNFESDSPEHLTLRTKDVAAGFGSRGSGRTVRTRFRTHCHDHGASDSSSSGGLG